MITEMIENTKIISVETYNSICNNAIDYMLSFTSDDPNIQHNFTLKREHINRVIGYTEVITRSLECESDVVMCTQLAALFHDIGRFEQFSKYQTFNDSISEDHAILAINIIKDKNWFVDLPKDFSDKILRTIFNHNKIVIPKNESIEVELLSKILRDADKIDILDILIRDFSIKNKNRNNAITYDLEPSSLVSKSVLKTIFSEKLPDKNDLRTITDFKLMLMAYVYDINFKISFSIINKKQYLRQIFDSLPKSDEVFEIYRKVKIEVENHLI